MVERIEERFERAAARLHASPLQKLAVIGPWRFAARYAARLLRVRAEREAELFFGVPMTVVLPEVISEAIYTYGVFDEIVTWLAVKHVKEGDVVLDIGAHFGYFSLLFSHLVGQHGKVLAFEPTPSTFTILHKNASARSNITALNLAVGSETGEFAISDYGLQYSAWNTFAGESRMPDVLNSHDSNRVMVKVVRLDDYLAQNAICPSLIKIDVENFEYEVISGLAETLRKYRPKIIIEAGSESSLKAGNLLAAAGYKAFISNGLGSLSAWEQPLELANARYKDILFLPLLQ